MQAVCQMPSVLFIPAVLRVIVMFFCKILRQGFVFCLVSSGLHLQHSVCQLSYTLTVTETGRFAILLKSGLFFDFPRGFLTALLGIFDDD